MTVAVPAPTPAWPADLVLVLAGAAAVGGLAFAIVRTNAGVFTYTLDDPYIHLALAQRIARGFYGINAGEPSSPSSSILYPLLLAPFAEQRTFVLLPLVYCAVGFGLSLLAVRRIFTSAGAPPVIAAAFAIAFALALNWIGLAFTGLEHALHVACSLGVVLGLKHVVDRGRIAPWFVAAIILGPALRYEGLAVSAAALAVLAMQGRLAAAIGIGAIVAAMVAAFSAFLVSQGLSPLPSSVLVKQAALRGGFDAGAATAQAVVWEVLHNVARNLKHTSGTVLALLANGALLRLVMPSADALAKPMAVFVIIVAAGHLAAGTYGWFMRYEIYALSTALGGTILVYRELLRSGLRRYRRGVAVVVMTTLAAIGAPYAQASGGIAQPLLIVRGSGDIFRQHYQMRRLVVDHLRAAVAVNDLGLVAFGNAGYVLDLWGLASEEARRTRLAAARPADWIDRLVRRHDVPLAMIYEKWFEGQIPSHWVRLGELESGAVSISASDNRVALYATDAAAAARTRSAVAQWAGTLPVGARFLADPQPRPAAP